MSLSRYNNDDRRDMWNFSYQIKKIREGRRYSMEMDGTCLSDLFLIICDNTIHIVILCFCSCFLAILAIILLTADDDIGDFSDFDMPRRHHQQHMYAADLEFQNYDAFRTPEAILNLT